MIKIKVLEVIDSLFAGGAESLLTNFLIESKRYNNFEIDVCTLYSRNIFENKLRANGIKVYNLNLSFKYDFFKIVKFINLVRSKQYNIIHVHLFPADLFVAISSLFIKEDTMLVFSEHSVYNRRRTLKFFRFIDKFTYSRYKKIICVSEEVKKALNEYIPETTNKSLVVKNSVVVPENFEDTQKIDKKFKYDVLFVGRLEEVKGVDILLKAVYYIKEKYGQSITVAIVGDGSKKDYLIKFARELKIDDLVEFTGIRQDVHELMKISKIFVLPSRWEGLPMVVLEAMANGIPVIATSVGGVPEIIEDQVNGILVPRENSKMLADKIFFLLNNAIVREKLAKNAYEKVRSHYSMEIYTKAILNLYEELFENAKKFS